MATVKTNFLSQNMLFKGCTGDSRAIADLKEGKTFYMEGGQCQYEGQIIVTVGKSVFFCEKILYNMVRSGDQL